MIIFPLNLLSIIHIWNNLTHNNNNNIIAIWGCENPACTLSLQSFSSFFCSHRVACLSFVLALRCRIYAKAIETYVSSAWEREKNGFYAVVLVCEQLYTHARTPDGIALSVVGCERTENSSWKKKQHEQDGFTYKFLNMLEKWINSCIHVWRELLM